jgi:hypothetical protein
MDNTTRLANLHKFAPDAVLADYSTEQPNPAFQGNPLIMALPPVPNDDTVNDSLKLTPCFAPSQRDLPTPDRLNALMNLENFMVPLPRHTKLFRKLDAMMRAGYVGRAPRTKEQTEILRAIYKRQKNGESFRQSADTCTPQVSASLIGISGMGKSTSLLRILACCHQVIYHEALAIYQIPYVIAEMPSDGKSIRSLLIAIIRYIDRLLPGMHYYDLYVGTKKPGADALMGHVAHLLTIHCVGLVVCEEVQNLENSNKSDQIVMTEMVSACNTLKIPLLFVGTNKAKDVLSRSFRQARRAPPLFWDRLRKSVRPDEADEFEIFLTVLWAFQWVRNAVALTEEFIYAMWDCSLGVIDIAIKIFAAAQGRAMLDGSETITAELIYDVYNTDWVLMHPMMDALRTNNLEALSRYEDIKPLALSDILSDLEIRYHGATSNATDVRPGDDTFNSRVAAAAMSLGMGEEQASALADKIAASPNVNNLHDATKELAKRTRPLRRVKRKAGEKSKLPDDADFSARPNDYRNAIVQARREGTTIMAQLKAKGMAPSVKDLLGMA